MASSLEKSVQKKSFIVSMSRCSAEYSALGTLPALRAAHELLVRTLDPREPKRARSFPVRAAAFPAADLDRVFSYDAFLRYVAPPH